MTEQRYRAVQGVLAEGRTIIEVASDVGVLSRTVHRWLARYEGEGLEGLGDRSHRPAHCPHQMLAAIEVGVLEMRRSHPYWGARRIAFELRRKGVMPPPSESAVYRYGYSTWPRTASSLPIKFAELSNGQAQRARPLLTSA